MRQVLLSGGNLVVEEVPAPALEAGAILVQTAFSCISSGTELAALRTASTPLWKRALAQPDKIRMVAGLALTEGPRAAFNKVRGKLAEPVALGYSASGTVVGVGATVEGFSIGDRVAVAGSQCAYHAQVLCVPRNLAVRLPDKVSLDHASTVALGAIALQGVRRAELTLGETVAVIGLGILGQLAVQLIRAAGCRVLALDLDSARVDIARDLGADVAMIADEASTEQVRRLTDGHGADAVIIAAAAASDDIVSSAFRMTRRKGRVILVGDVGLGLKRADIYAKEIDFRISCSYGPGRYDADYEERGIDYPLAYVRWTENRNMTQYLRLVEAGSVRLEPLIGGRHDLDAAAAVYADLGAGRGSGLVGLFSYPQDPSAPSRRVVGTATTRPRLPHDMLRVGVIGAGQFARAMHLPILRDESARFAIRGVAARNGHKAMTVAREFAAAFATTDPQAVIDDPETDAVLIATRHDTHAALALRALAAGKNVLLEKPLALNATELADIELFFDSAEPRPILQTGFNRRFSAYAARMHELLEGRAGPLMMSYRMNAGYIDPDHWVHGPEGGGRNLGEACHVYDLFCFLVGAGVERVEAMSLAPQGGRYRRDDNFCATVRFADGSVASLLYTALGAPAYPKEQLEVYYDGRVMRMDNYVSLSLSSSATPLLTTPSPEKGVPEQWLAFSRAVSTGCPAVPVADQVAATRIALAVQERLFS